MRLTPTTETVPPVAAQETRVEHGGVGPDRLDDDLGAPSTGRLEHLRRSGCEPGVDGLGAEALGPGQPLGHHVHGQDAGRTEERGALQRHDADRAEPDDDHGRPRPDGGPQRAEVAGREDVGEQHGLLVGHALGDGEREEVGERHRHGFGLPAGQIGHRAERGRLAGQADVGLAGQAGRARHRTR